MDKFITVSMGKYTNIKTGKLDANACSDDGQYPFFTCAKEPLKISSYSYDCECVLVAGNGDLNVKYYQGKFDAYQRTYIIESCDKEKLNTRYMFYFLENYIEKLREQSIGGVIKYIKLNNLTEVLIPLPPLKTQYEIVDILDRANILIEKRKVQIDKLDLLMKSQFTQMFGDPVTNPMEWEVDKLFKLGDVNRGVSKHRPRNDPKLLGGKYPLIQTGDVANSGLYITKFTNTYSELGLAQSKIWEKGTLCITIAANIAKTSILDFDACFPDSVVGFLPYKNTNTIFMYFWFLFFQKILELQAPESAQKNINLKILYELEVICPPIILQNKFANFVHQVERQKQILQDSLEKLERNYQSLIQKCFRGEIF